MHGIVFWKEYSSLCAQEELEEENWRAEHHKSLTGRRHRGPGRGPGTRGPGTGDQGLPEEVAIEEPLDSRDIAKGEAAGPVTD